MSDTDFSLTVWLSGDTVSRVDCDNPEAMSKWLAQQLRAPAPTVGSVVEQEFGELLTTLDGLYRKAEEMMARGAADDSYQNNEREIAEVRARLTAKYEQAVREMDAAVMEAIEQTVQVCDSHEREGVPREARVVDYARILTLAKRIASRTSTDGAEKTGAEPPEDSSFWNHGTDDGKQWGSDG